MAIGLPTSSKLTIVDFKGSISIPNGPDPISYGKFLLESFAHPPLVRYVLGFNFNVIRRFFVDILDTENGHVVLFSDDVH